MTYQTVTRNGNMSLQYGGAIGVGAWTKSFERSGVDATVLTSAYEKVMGMSDALKRRQAWSEFLDSHGVRGKALSWDLDGSDTANVRTIAERLNATHKATAPPAAHVVPPASAPGWMSHLPSLPSLSYAARPGAALPSPSTVVMPPAASTATAQVPGPPSPGAPTPSPGAPTPAGVSVIQRAKDELAGASPLERIRLLEVLQSSPGIQELVKAGLFDWREIMKPNPSGPDHVSNPDGADPEMVVDGSSLDKLQSALLEYAQRQQNAQTANLQHYAQDRATPGSKKSTGFYPDRDVFMYPRHIAGTLPNRANVGWSGDPFTKAN